MTEKEFIQKWVNKFTAELEKSFPQDFLPDTETNVFQNNGRRLIVGSEFFGALELIDSNGQTVLTTDSFDEIKYYVYASRTKPQSFPVPKDKSELKSAVKNYEAFLDEFLKMIFDDFKTLFPDSPNFNRVSGKIFLSLDLQRLS